MPLDPMTAANKAMWNQTAGVHARVKLGELLEGFRDPAFSVLDPIETAVLERIGVAGKRVIQLSCNNARELLSVARMGATEAVGVDVSDAFLAQAARLEAVARNASPLPPVRFVESDVLQLPSDLDGRFDLVTVTIGAIGWIRDLDAWWRVVERVLAPGGRAFLYEMHPILDMFDADAGPKPRHSYFRTEPYVEDSGPDYFDPSATVEGTSYWFHHRLDRVIGGALEAGLRLEHFEEFPHDISNVFASFGEHDARFPLCYTLVAAKPG